jgi:Fe2+ transport system protein FeoA
MFRRFSRQHGRRRRTGFEGKGEDSSDLMPLTALPAGKSGTIVRFHGGPWLARKLSVLGLRPGKRVRKVSTMVLRGPVHVKVGQVEVGLGHRMAERVLVRPD